MTLLIEQEQSDDSPIKGDEVITIAPLVRELMHKRKRLPSQLAADLGISHPTIARWLSGKSIPSTDSCRKLAKYSQVPLKNVLRMAGHLPRETNNVPVEWPEFREYAYRKYRDELDEDTVTVIEGLIERRRAKRHNR